jgi:exosortase/archaeosortase family protein
MRLRRSGSFVHVALVVLTVILGFFVLQEPIRRVETSAAAWLLEQLAGGGVAVFAGTSIQVFPSGHEPFRAIVSPSCSSTASLFALVALSSLAPRCSRRRRSCALALALATVFCGNVLRITASLAVGFVAGHAALILFHDWAGSIFTFVYTLGGFVLMLYILLPGSAPGRAGLT